VSAPDEFTIRPLTVEDRTAIERLPERVSPQTSIARFHGAISRLSNGLVDVLLDLQPGRHEAVVAIDSGGIIGVARYVRDEPDASTAEVAVLIADEWQHRGVAPRILRPLARSALRAGITHFWADIPPENTAALRLFADLAPTATKKLVSGRMVMAVDLADALHGQ
jgi:acetyltransferase